MAKRTYSLRLDDDLHDRAEEVFLRLGISFTNGVQMYLAHVAREKRIPFNLQLKDDGEEQK